MNQLAFDLALLARRFDPSTSHDAATRAKALQVDHHAIILAALAMFGAMGKDGIAARTRLDGVAVARRLPELERMGLAKPTGRKVPSTSGREEREWAVL